MNAASPFRHYLAIATMSCATFLTCVAAINLALDPLWCFGSRHALNARTSGFDERQQKTNRLAFGRPEFDAVLIGSSRCAYIHEGDVPGVRVFNYAVGMMGLDEMPAYLGFAMQNAPAGVREVLVGLDFEGTSQPRHAAKPPMPPEHYLERVSDPTYRLKTALSWEALTHAVADLSHDPLRDYYDRENRKHHRATDDRMLLVRTNQSARVFRRHFGAAYAYDPAYPERLERLKAAAGHARLRVFTTPVSTVLLEIMREEGRVEDYRRWLREVVAAFGEVDHFMDDNGVTRDLRHFVDGHHIRPTPGSWIVRRVMGAPTPEAPADFGVRLTAETLDAYLAHATDGGSGANR